MEVLPSSRFLRKTLRSLGDGVMCRYSMMGSQGYTQDAHLKSSVLFSWRSSATNGAVTAALSCLHHCTLLLERKCEVELRSLIYVHNTAISI